MLTVNQRHLFDIKGFLFLPECFSQEEVTALREAADTIFSSPRQEIWNESSGAPRTAFACHTYHEAFAILARHPRVVRPVREILGDEVYVHQFKVNAKAAFSGDVWQWHQDFPTWHKEDGMPMPHAMNISVFLDEVLPINGPLMFIAGSHTLGEIPSTHDTTTTNYPLWSLDNATVARLADEGGIAAPTGKAGGVLLHHGNLVHGSAGNITPYPRKIVYLTLCAVSNAIQRPRRPEYIANTDFTPITPGSDDELLNYARAARLTPWRGDGNSVGR